jgi:hypothetical protein
MTRSAVAVLVGGLAGLSLLPAAGPADLVTAETSELKIAARVIADKNAQVKAVGSDLNRQYVIIELTVTPRGGYPVAIARDHFLLRSERDNERGSADSPDRVAGEAVLVLGSKGGSTAPVFSESKDPLIVGGLPGTGRPQRVGGQDQVFGGGGSEGGQTTVTAGRSQASPLLRTLREKELPEGETGKPVAGFLYFPVDPNQKTKNFVLHYKGPGGACQLRFK